MLNFIGLQYCVMDALQIQYKLQLMAQQPSRNDLMGTTVIEQGSGSKKLDGRYYMLNQKHDTLQCLFCCFCEASNEYMVSQSDPNFNVTSKKGYIKETSDCMSRCLCVCNRPFQASMKLFGQELAIAERPCKCWLQWMPCLENELIIRNSSGRVLGILRVGCRCFGGNHYTCADAQIHVLNGQTEEVMYTIEGGYFQKSILCPCFRCCYCPNIDYTIYDNLNLKVGKISNIYNGCFAELFTRADKFGIELPPKADEDQKIVLLYAAVYLDYLRYETPIFCLGIR